MELNRREFTKSIAALFAGLSAGFANAQPKKITESTLPAGEPPLGTAYQYVLPFGLKHFGLFRTDSDDLLLTYSDKSKRWESQKLPTACGKAEYQFHAVIYNDQYGYPAMRADCKCIRGRDIYGIHEA